ncbi:3-phosphoshikimate 1-carboxyvinyltransferase [Granulimonas faecalis]|uniref:3-phosphoshikimate 1-carboxyvinyltransferase n=1 Tax=Granulimonas faecalis TaxID=2894155 RepID=A0AAV5B524_9ACTN|nr:3-phosphoshikimate 1-carboxyvinyltransferase [Granulimonas faecalis]GJM55425.1 3-phosphoshikimate 1-carboxyvinyltransferase [Granulimonas faecalis]
MDLVVGPGPLQGGVHAPSSKSVAHRALVCAAASSAPTFVECTDTSQDIDATARCLAALGASVEAVPGRGFSVSPVPDAVTGPVTLDCGESGSTLRFMVPFAAALGADATFVGARRLLERPMAPLEDALAAHGVSVSRGDGRLRATGRMTQGTYAMPGDVSSQFVSGILMASPLVGGPVSVDVSGPVASAPYIALTASVMAGFGRPVSAEGRAAGTVYAADGTGRLVAPGGTVEVEGDWSNAAFWLVAGALGSEVAVTGVDRTSAQGDRAVTAALALLGASVSQGARWASASVGEPRAATLDVEQTPDLVPPLAVAAALAPGTSRITGTARLRIKESDRVATVAACLRAVGADVSVEGDDILVHGGAPLPGGAVDAANDHRIAMMAAVAATRCEGPVTIRGAECVAKSYPRFFDDYAALGGTVREVRP